MRLRNVSATLTEIKSVRKELRTPVLYAPVWVTGSRSLRVFRILTNRPSKLQEGVSVQRTAVEHDISALIYERPERSRPSAALLWIHGGGFVMGQARMDHDRCSQFAGSLDVVVVSVEYRLAPEDPYPSALEDCYSALKWLHDSADRLGVDPDRIAVGGASAGGGLAASVAQAALDRGDVPVAFQALMYPMLDDRTGVEGAVDGRGLISWTAASNRYAWHCYLGDSGGVNPEYAAPGRRADLSGLPPAWIGVGDRDLFYNESREYAGRLIDAEVGCSLDIEPGMFHGADVLLAAKVRSMADLRSRMVTAVGVALGCER